MYREVTPFEELLTGWSLVRIRPGEPNKNKDLAAQTSAENHLKVSPWQHLWQQLTDFARYRLSLLVQAINRDDADRAAKIIQDALGIESDDVANYCFPKNWPADREQRARIIGEWLQTEARFVIS
jgi:uncharacterized protein HemY